MIPKWSCSNYYFAFRFVLEWLSFKVRIRKCDDYNKTVDRSNACSRNPYNIKDRRSHVKQLSVANRVGVNSKLRETIQQNTEITLSKNKTCVPLFSISSDKSDDLIYNRNNFSNKCHEADILLQKVDILIGKLQDLDRESRIKAEWRLVAMTIDRCLLILFAVIFIATLFGCFLNAPSYVPWGKVIPLIITETITLRCSAKRLFWKISWKSRDNISLIKYCNLHLVNLFKIQWQSIFIVNFANFSWTPVNIC